MDTEAKIVYSIIATAKKNKINDDSRINERVVRTYLQGERADLLDQMTMGGMKMSDECFQPMGALQFSYLRPRVFSRKMPQVVRLQQNAGIMLSKYGEPFSVVAVDEFRMGQRHLINKYHPKASYLFDTLSIYIGLKRTDCEAQPELNETVDAFEQDIIDSNGAYILAEVNAVLQNPSDSPTYDWTKDPYPFPAELINDMVTNILRRQYNIILQVKTDKVADGEEKNQE